MTLSIRGNALRQEFKESPGFGLFNLAPQQAIDFFQAKGLKPSFDWQDMIGEEHLKAFTIAKMMQVDLLKDTQGFLRQTLVQGKSKDWFIANLTPHLQSKGWWGKAMMLDPVSDQFRTVQLGSATRLSTIYRTNIQSSYAVGHWQQIQVNADTAPWLLYDAVDDHRTRTEHARLDGTLLKVDDPFWSQYYPPNGWNCRCSAIQLSETEKKEMGLLTKQPAPAPVRDWTNPKTGKVSTIPTNLDPGWNINMGQLHKESLDTALAEKVVTLEARQAEKTALSLEKANKLNQALASQIGKAEMERLKNATQLKILEEQNKKLLADILAGTAKDPGKHKLTALKKLNTSQAFVGMDAKTKLTLVNSLADTLKEKKKTLGHLNDYKKKILAGKVPTPAQKKALESLDEIEKEKFLAKIDQALKAQDAIKLEAAKAKAEQAAKDLGLEPSGATQPRFEDRIITMDELTQIGGQGGSNAGGLYQNINTGEKFYIKFPGSEDSARNEVLASKLYQIAGVQNSSKAHLFTTQDGRVGIASEFIEGLEISRERLVGGQTHGIHEGFAADAWLANWDVVGLGYDNLLIKNGMAYRIDPGGALRYRAQGGQKGAAFGRTVTELESLRNPGMNPQSSQVFGRISRDDMIAGVRNIAAIPDSQLAQVLDKYGPRDAATRAQLLDILKARRDYLLDQYPEARVIIPEPTPAVRITQAEYDAIRDSRVNGFSLLTDKGDIEDHDITLSRGTRQDGTQYTRAWLKLTPEGQAKLQGVGVQPGFNDEGLFDDMLLAIKGISMQIKKGEALRPKDLERAVKALETYGKLLEAKPELTAHYQGWAKALAKLTDGKDWEPPTGILSRYEPKVEATAWARESIYSYNLNKFDNSFARERADRDFMPGSGHRFLDDGKGLQARLFLAEDQGAFANHGLLAIDIDGDQAAGIDHLFDFLDNLGIDTTRPDRNAREELYLDKLAYILTTGKSTAVQNYRNIKTGNLVEKRDFVSTFSDVDDITQTPGYNPAGRRQAFDTGRVNQYRPDLDTPTMDQFIEDHFLYNNPTGLNKRGSGVTDQGMLDSVLSVIQGGGMISSLQDRARRGVVSSSASSASSDFSSGGASYVFTRIKPKNEMAGQPGLYWKADELKRVDAIAYGSDQYGETTPAVIQANRAITPEQYTRNGRASTDEVIFKNGLSYFDNLAYLVFPTEAGRKKAIRELKKLGYALWPDGRPIEDVILSASSHG